MPFQADLSTDKLSVTEGSGGPVFAAIDSGTQTSYVKGKLSIGGETIPLNTLDVEGALAVGAGYSGTAVAPLNGAVFEGNVGIGTASPLAKLQVAGGALMPSVGNTAGAGILFPQNPGGGAGDAAWMRYYVRAGESTTLEIGVSNDADDHIALMASGNVGIGTLSPVNKLDVSGDIAVRGKHALRGSDSWLRLNQDGAFTSGVHTPGVLAPGSLNVGGVGGWGNPGAGNAWIAGALTIGSNPVRFTSAWSGFPDSTTNQAEISNDTGTYKTLMIVGNKSAGVGRRVSIWDRLEVHGEVAISGQFVTVNGAGGEQSYFGGDGWGNDVQIGSSNAGVTNVGFWNSATATRMNLYARSYVQVSDAKLKTNIEPIPSAIEKVLKLRGVKFDWADDAHRRKEGKRVGLIAQDVLDIVPEAVSKDSKGMHGIDYGCLVSILIEAIKEQNLRLERLEAAMRAAESASAKKQR